MLRFRLSENFDYGLALLDNGDTRIPQRRFSALTALSRRRLEDGTAHLQWAAITRVFTLCNVIEFSLNVFRGSRAFNSDVIVKALNW